VRLNELIESLGGPSLTTVFVGKLDPTSRTLKYANAGHPPALHLQAGGNVLMLDDVHGLPLGVGSEVHAKQTVRVLQPHDLLLLFTDGLVERRDLPIGDGLERLRRCLQGSAATCEAVLAKVVHTLAENEPEDDVALLAIEIAG
jgi:serine phosphatase RsbU (regulator of sigma subunit)